MGSHQGRLNFVGRHSDLFAGALAGFSAEIVKRYAKRSFALGERRVLLFLMSLVGAAALALGALVDSAALASSGLAVLGVSALGVVECWWEP